jgi:hypothetical protein
MDEKLKSLSYEIIPGWGFVFHRSFTTPADKDFCYHRIWDYLHELYYRVKPGHPYLFLRGSIEVESIVMSPVYLPTEVKITLKEATLDYNTDVEVELRVCTKEWKWLQADPEFWKAELDGLQTAISKGIRDIRSVHKVQNRIMLPLSLILASPFILLVGFLFLLFLGLFLTCSFTPFC